MICTLAIFLAMQDGKQLVQQSGAQVVSKVFLRYARAQSLSGTIVQSTSDGAGIVTFKTNVSYVRPAKLYIAQNRTARNGLNLLAVSDGKTFIYDHPRDSSLVVPAGDRLSDKVSGVHPLTGEPYTQAFGQMYAVTHASMEPVTSLDIAFAHEPHLSDFTGHVVSAVLSGSVVYKGSKVYRVTGAWRYYKGNRTSGRWEMLVSSEYDILRFTLVERYAVRGKSVDLTIIETVDLKVGAEVDDAVFKVR